MTETVTLTKAELDAALEEAAERGAKKVLHYLGWNANDEHDRQEITRDLLFLRDTRRGSRAVRLGAAVAITTSAVGAIGTLLWLGFQTAIKHFPQIGGN